ncbi:hypothetical protein C9374_013613 [Naegleria lovaniensis]|uniref:Uncharacterized protein n=1 Tax=Naegleria lovaniensis TaxID=51637 RepID=A0AA88KHC7_NAELO|nr:uncharacterized protein C9374_013613 [Naegleria lovaniensis]KAG2372712.1 hypothetical protein C9374_013613 [Naegleria lovaniensis]
MRLYATLLNPCSRGSNKLVMSKFLFSASSSTTTPSGMVATHTSSNLIFNNHHNTSRHFSSCSIQCADESQSSSSPSSSDRKPQGERKPFVKNYDRQQNKQQQYGGGERRFNNSNSQQGERRQFSNQQGGTKQPYQRTQQTTQSTQYVKKPYYKPRTTEGEQTSPTTGTTPSTSTGTSATPKAKRTISKEEAENLLKEAQKLKELQKKLNKNSEESSGTTAPVDDDAIVMEEDLVEPSTFVDKSALSEEIEKKKYLRRLEGKKTPNAGEKAASTKKKGAKKRERKRGSESEESEEGAESNKSLQMRKKTQDEEDILKVDIEMNEKYAEYLDRMYTGTTPRLLAEQQALLSKRGLIPTLSEMGAEHGSNFTPMMKQLLAKNLVRDEQYEFLFSYMKNYQNLARKILESMEDKERATELQEIYPLLAESSSLETTSRKELEDNFDKPETRATLYSLFDPDYFVNMEAVETKAAKDLERLSKEGQLTPQVLEPYKQEISTSMLAEKLLDYFNSKLFTLQIGGVVGVLLQPETIKRMAEDCFDTVVRKRGSAAIPYLPESERNFIEERERKLETKYGITRDNLHTFVSKDKMYQEDTFQSLNGRIEELLSKKRLNRIAIDNRFKLEQPNEDFDHEDAYYYGDEENPVERKKEISRAVQAYMADYEGLPLKNHVSTLFEKVRQRVYLLKRFVYEPKFETLAYIRDVPFSSGLYHHAGKTGKYAKFAPLERNFDEIIESNTAPDTVARLVLTNYSRALGQNDTLDFKSKMELMHRFGAYVKKVDSEGGVEMPSPIRPGKRTHMHPNRVNPRDAELDVYKIDDENHPFWKEIFANIERVQQVSQKRKEKEIKKSNIGRGGKPAPVKAKKK